MSNSNETMKDKITSQIELSKQRVLDHLSIKDFYEIPLSAKCYALADLEMKFLFSGENRNLNEGYYYVACYYLKDYYLKNVEENKKVDPIELQKRKLKPEQKEFLTKFRKGLIEEYSTFSLAGGEKYELAKKTCMQALYDKFKDNFDIPEEFKDAKTSWGKLVLSKSENFELAKNALKYEMLHLDEISLQYNSNEDFTFNVLLYAYYISKYREFLFEKDPHIFDEVNTIELTKYSAEVNQIYKRLDQLFEDFKINMPKTNNGNMPKLIYTFVDGFSDELVLLKEEVGVDNKLYILASSEIIKFVTGWINKWVIDEDVNLLIAHFQGSVSGKSLVEECEMAFKQLNSIEMEADTRKWFDTQKQYFELYQQKITPKSGCYIATMAYGDYNHPQVILLRNFRDNSLAKFYWGREFIRFYYWLSPKIVERCKNNSFIVQTSRKILDNLIKFI